ncbi:ABC transporter ATP-binding protein [Mesorhizobium silamurunense]|uniref:ABC transporter ATP-binding protein n=1 Tax=Mesorhizobium silamurunense TaxID=499528 RepID=UPI0017861045|nr:ABC transporter ATP-binding protein [Mesorhizobium silamurunense]
MSGIVLGNIRKSFGPTTVLHDVSLSIADGEFLTLLGPSGCGKSTLLRILAGLELQDAGSVSIGDRVVDGVRPKRRDVAMVFQSYALYPHMTVAGNIALPLRMRRLNAWQRLPLLGRLLPGTRTTTLEITAEVARTAEALSIDHLLTRKPSQLSGGQRQRVAVGRAMVRHPAVFLMDEPLSNLDAKLRVQMRAEIKELHQRLGVTFVYVTHDQAEAMTLSDRVAVMLNGELLQVAPPQDIYADPEDRRVAEFIGSPKINMLDGLVSAPGSVSFADTTIVADIGLSPGAHLKLGIRPEAFRFGAHSERGAISGTVRLVEHMGSDLYVHLDVAGAKQPIVARLSAERTASASVGQRLNLSFEPERVLYFGSDGRRIRALDFAGKAAVTSIRESA